MERCGPLGRNNPDTTEITLLKEHKQGIKHITKTS